MEKNQDLSFEKRAALESLINNPTIYHVSVENNTSLPDKLKKKDKITFEVKPPVMSTLTKVAVIVEKLPPELFEPKNINANVYKYVEEMVDIICIFSHGNSKKKMPEWYKDFLMQNLTPDDVTYILQECFAKCKTGFFLPFFQNAKAINPMSLETMEEREKLIGTTRGSS